jgi:ABC-2 type transport system permease protein
MRAYLSIFRIKTAESFQYRLAALSGSATSFLWAVIEVAAFTVFFKYAGNAGFAGGLTLAQTISHVWVRELLLFMQPYNIDEDLRDKLTGGDVGVEMCRPLDVYWHWFARTSAGKIVVFVMRCLTCFLAAFLLPAGFRASLPVSFGGFLLFLPAVLCAYLLCCSFLMLMTAVRTNIKWGDGPMYLLGLTGGVLSGGYLPLQLWPDFMQAFLFFQPFAGICDIPARLYIGSMPPSEAWLGMSVQLFWSAVFISLGRLIMSRKLKDIVIQGG